MSEAMVKRMERALRALETGARLPRDLSADELADLAVARRLVAIGATESAPEARPWSVAAGSVVREGTVQGELRYGRRLDGVLARLGSVLGDSKGPVLVAGRGGTWSRETAMLALAVVAVVLAVGALVLQRGTDVVAPPQPAASTAVPAVAPTDLAGLEERPVADVVAPATSSPRPAQSAGGATLPTRSAEMSAAHSTPVESDSALVDDVPLDDGAGGEDDSPTVVPAAAEERPDLQEPTETPTEPAPTATEAPTSAPAPSATHTPGSTPVPTARPRPSRSATAPATAPVPATMPGGSPGPTRTRGSAVTATPPATWTGGVPTADYTTEPDPGPPILPTYWTPAPTETPGVMTPTEPSTAS